ncbi:histidine kinase [Micromonospora sp. NPDC049559]|uniref:sensor histidine kinase n=1 Tax=Micromonospora sp. NPDC049559 TaxID=3155923 RepID=UPI0034304C3B
MTRSPLGAVAVGADCVLLLAAHRGWWVLVFAVLAAATVALERRWPVAAFVVVLALAAWTGMGFALLLWGSYRAGLDLGTPPRLLVTTGATAGALATQLALRAAPTNQVGLFVIFVVLPLLVGRYLAQHHRLLETLRQHNLDLRRNQELLADRERLRERLRIARDVHDALGHRLSLVSVQAATLEVADLPARSRETVRQLAGSARQAMDELHELVGALRGAEPGAVETGDDRSPGLDAVDGLVAGFAAAGVPVTLVRQGGVGTLGGAAERAAYRLVEEGLTNASKHAPGQPVTVSLTWEGETLIVTVTNPLPPAGGSARSAGGSVAGALGGSARPAGPAAGAGGLGHGLAGLRERVELAGGVLATRRSDAEGFRLFAMLPAAAAAAAVEEEAGPDSAVLAGAGPGGAAADGVFARPAGRAPASVLGWLVAGIIFGVLPALTLLGPAR